MLLEIFHNQRTGQTYASYRARALTAQETHLLGIYLRQFKPAAVKRQFLWVNGKRLIPLGFDSGGGGGCAPGDDFC